MRTVSLIGFVIKELEMNKYIRDVHGVEQRK